MSYIVLRDASASLLEASPFDDPDGKPLPAAASWAAWDQSPLGGNGVAAALVSTLVGFLLLGVAWGLWNGYSLQYFVVEVFVRSPLYRDSILTVSVLTNAAGFWWALRTDRERFARGVVAVVLLAVPVIVWLQTLNVYDR